MAEKIRSVKGMPDILGASIKNIQAIEKEARGYFESAGFCEIRTPLLEDVQLFKRSIGDTTDIVEKEMYTLLDRNDKMLALRPEGTASVVRAYIDQYAAREPDQRLYYLGPMYRYERPQKGRFRQFHQFGAEIFGPDDPYVDAELLKLVCDLLARLNIKNYKLFINSLGTKESRQSYREILVSFLETVKEELCDQCLDRIGRNPLRVLDCKLESCQKATVAAPSLLDHLDEKSAEDFKKLKELLDIMKVQYTVNPRLVRGLDYYEKTAFEFVSDDLGAQSAFAGGGRYNGLVKQLGGPDISAIGFAFGMERLELLFGLDRKQPKEYRISFIPMGEKAHPIVIQYLHELRNPLNAHYAICEAGSEFTVLGKSKNNKDVFGAKVLDHRKLVVQTEYGDRSLKAKMKRAHRFVGEYGYVIIVGDNELEKQKAICKSMESGQQEEVSLVSFEAFRADLESILFGPL